MKIVKLIAENIKKIRAVEITPDGDIVTIAGRNGAGKTSVLDSIWWALSGSTNIQKQPIRKGQTKARIRLDLGDYIVERKFTEAGSSLFVESADGARFPSPQTLLDKLIGELSFDPLAFARKDAKDQFEELRRISHLEVDIDKLDGMNRADYGQRTEYNREAKAKKAFAAAIPVPENLPEAAIDESGLLDKITEAAEANAQLEQRKAKRADTLRMVQAIKAGAEHSRTLADQKRREAAAFDAEVREKTEEAVALQKKFDDAPPLPEPTDISDLRANLDAAKKTNSGIAQREKRQAAEAHALELETASKRLTEQMDARDTAKREAVMAAKMPVDGLGFGDGMVTLNGIPFDQASSAEQLRVSLSIAMAANPKLRVIRIQDGSLLDKDSLAQIAAMAKAGDYQVWLEKVDDSGKVGIVIEDGAVVSTPESRGEADA